MHREKWFGAKYFSIGNLQLGENSACKKKSHSFSDNTSPEQKFWSKLKVCIWERKSKSLNNLMATHNEGLLKILKSGIDTVG